MLNGENLDEHLRQSRLLQPSPYVDFFDIRVNPTVQATRLFLTTHPDIEWNGQKWLNFPLELSGDSLKTGGELVRPQLKLGNPQGIFSYAISANQIYSGTVRRYRVLRTHLESGAVSFLTNFWDIGKVASLNRDYLVLELRSPMDRHDYNLPARQFFPPEFPYVKLN